jgi:hypothetical protein
LRRGAPSSFIGYWIRVAQPQRAVPNRDLVELDDLARTLDECEAAGITPEDAAKELRREGDS